MELFALRLFFFYYVHLSWNNFKGHKCQRETFSYLVGGANHLLHKSKSFSLHLSAVFPDFYSSNNLTWNVFFTNLIYGKYSIVENVEIKIQKRENSKMVAQSRCVQDFYTAPRSIRSHIIKILVTVIRDSSHRL